MPECWRVTGKAPVGGRWANHNNGDDRSPNVRSRCVAKDIARWKDDARCADAPPLEAARLLLSDLATAARGTGARRGSGEGTVH